MSEPTYNGWTNRATWLVNVWGNPESREDVRMLKQDLEDQYDEMPNGILKDILDLSEINWEELEGACEPEDFECSQCANRVAEDGDTCEDCQFNQEDPCEDEPNLPDLERDRQVEAQRLKR